MTRLPSLPGKKALIAVALVVLLVSSGCVGMVKQVDSQVDGSQPNLEYVAPDSGTQFHPVDQGYTYLVRYDNGTIEKIHATNLSAANISENVTVLFNGRKATKILHQRIQEYREQKGKEQTRLSPVLMSTARAKTHHMVANEYYSHYYNTKKGEGFTGHPPEGGENETIEVPNEFAQRGNTLKSFSNVYPQMEGNDLAENLMMTTRTYRKTTDANLTRKLAINAFHGWKNSPRHNDLMLSSSNTVVGYGFDFRRVAVGEDHIRFKVYTTLHAARPTCSGNNIHPFSDPCEAEEEFREKHDLSTAS